MASAPRRPTAPTTESSSIPDLVEILKVQGLLTKEEEDQVQRYIQMQQLSEEAAIRRLGKYGEDEITQAVVKHAKLPYLKINPLDLDLDVVTAALLAPFASILHASHDVRGVEAR